MAVTAETNGTNGHSNGVPEKKREVSNHHMDSTIWNELEMRPDDIVIATYAKSGTTWTQQIVGQLVHQADPTIAAGSMSPWVDLRVIPREVMLGMLGEQKHRRFMKTHLPRDALRWDPKAKYIFIGRDGRDMIWSAHHHFTAANPIFYEMFAQGEFDGPKLQRPADDPREMFVSLLDRENGPDPAQMWPFWSHIRSWWEVKDHPNLMLVHYNDLKADLDGEMRKIAKFLGTPEMTKEQWDAAVEHCTFDWMKEHAELAAPPQAEMVFEQGAKSFINKGTNARWKDRLSEEDCQRYEAMAREELGEECARWLQYGNQKA
ncbi:P-loop containing nucleoside triphosphate hydrolase protein [Sarocladium strictum]